jgi:hypothetical protein
VRRTIPCRARRLAAQLELKLTADAALATALNDAHGRLRRANDRLWQGLHPDGVALLYGDCLPAVDASIAQNRSEILTAAEPLCEIQNVHWTINRAFGDYQAAAEHRRHLAIEVGELAQKLIATLVAAGWSEAEARGAHIPNLANSSQRGSAG